MGSRWALLGNQLGQGISQGIQPFINQKVQANLMNRQIENFQKLSPQQQQVYLQLQGGKGVDPLQSVLAAILSQQLGIGGMGGFGDQGGMPPPPSGAPTNGSGYTDDPARNPNFNNPVAQGGGDGVAKTIYGNMSIPQGSVMVQDQAGNRFYQDPQGRLYNLDGSSAE